MKKIKLLLLLVILSGGLAVLFPCDIRFETAKIIENDKNKINVKVLVEKIHTRCPVNIEKTWLLFNGIKIEKQSQWKKVEVNIYQMDLTITLNRGEKGEIRCIRACPKTGTQEETLKLDPL